MTNYKQAQFSSEVEEEQMEYNHGFIKVHRKLLEWEWYHDEKMLKLWIHLLLTANWKDKKWEGTVIKRGQLITSSANLAAQLHFGRQTVRTLLNRLTLTNQLTIESTKRYTIITICKYDSYQDRKTTTNHVSNQPANQQLTNVQPTANQQLTTTKEGKERKERKEERRAARSSVNFLLAASSREELQKQFPRVNAASEMDIMLDWLKANGKRYKDYAAFARNWLRRKTNELPPSPTAKMVI